MDDYNVSVLSEAKNEYCARLTNLLTPCILEGIKSIYDEAWKLCIDNDEKEKYLMTFQNFLSRVIKWNQTIINNETQRIINISKCDYLEDLITCVHITQLKVLTCIRVGSNSKKIELDIPRVEDFIHNIYIKTARKIYSNVYLFEKNVLPLQYQKNMRECQILIKESILETIRDSMPIEHILRSYIDNTEEEEIVETTEEVIEEIKPETTTTSTDTQTINTQTDNIESLSSTADVETSTTSTLTEGTTENISKADNITIKKISTGTEAFTTNDTVSTDNNTTSSDNVETKIITAPISLGNSSSLTTNNVVEPINDTETPSINTENIKIVKTEQDKPVSLSFNNNDEVLDMGTNVTETVEAPKTIERLEEISTIRNEQRKLDDESDDDDDDGYLADSITIHDDAPITLDKTELHDLNTSSIKIEPDIILDDIEILH